MLQCDPGFRWYNGNIRIPGKTFMGPEVRGAPSRQSASTMLIMIVFLSEGT